MDWTLHLMVERDDADINDKTSARNGLFQVERQEQIVELVLRNGSVDVAELAERFDVTTETIRRDLTDLQEDRLIRRVHGGAVPWRSWLYEPKLEVRGGQNAEEKQRIAKMALEEVPDQGSIMIDSGSTAAHFADLLPLDRQLTVITNSIPIVQSLAASNDMELIVVGGTLRKNTMALVDASGAEALHDVNVDVLFIGCDGVSLERGFTTPYRDEVTIKRAMMAAARRIVMMFDHSKVGNDQLLRFASIDEVDRIITGREVDDSIVSRLQEKGPTVTLA